MATSILLLVFLVCIVPATAFFKGSNDITSSDNCVYTVFVRTGSVLKGGTDSIIGIELFDSYNNSVEIINMEKWGGLMPVGWNYYERGNLDVFSGRGYCLSTSPCKIVVTSDGSGDHHGWYVNYMEVTITGPHLGCAQRKFTIEQWLAKDAYPYQLSTSVDKCSSDDHVLKIVDKQ